MAKIRGERFELNLDDNDDSIIAQPYEPPTPSDFIGDIQERQIVTEVAPPSIKSRASGFPEHKKRTGVSKFKQDRSGIEVDEVASNKSTNNVEASSLSGLEPSNTDDLSLERKQIDAENTKAISNMSKQEIAQEREELFAGLNPALIEKLLKRSTIDDDPLIKNQQDVDPKSAGTEIRRPSTSERRVSFALPETEYEKRLPTPSASKHSINASPSSMLATKLGDGSSSDISAFNLSRTSSNTSMNSTRSISSHATERKVSFASPDDGPPEVNTSPTAVSHSISHSPMVTESDRGNLLRSPEISYLDLANMTSSSSRSPKQRPANYERKVSFALPDVMTDEGRPSSSAASHSLTGSPSPKAFAKMDSIDGEVMEGLDLSQSTGTTSHEGGSIHFPQAPAAPELDPNSETFLEDLHEKYFPNLAHDPSKLAWMAPATDEENAAYDPSRANLDPKDVRFDFKGQIIPPSRSAQIPTSVGLHHHGDAPSAAGYTIAELGLLARSAFAPQRSIAIQTLGRLLYRLGSGEFGNENFIGAAGRDGDRAFLAKGLWDSVDAIRAIDTLTEEANKDRGHQTSIALAQEAVWNWRRGGGRLRKAV